MVNVRPRVSQSAPNGSFISGSCTSPPLPAFPPMLSIEIRPHPALAVAAFATTFPRPLGELPTPRAILALLDGSGPAPMKADERTRTEVRDMLRIGGYKPTGRGKPAS